MNRAMPPRAPEQPYACGFSPAGHRLKGIYGHWCACTHPHCVTRLANWDALRIYWQERERRETAKSA